MQEGYLSDTLIRRPLWVSRRVVIIVLLLPPPVVLPLGLGNPCFLLDGQSGEGLVKIMSKKKDFEGR